MRMDTPDNVDYADYLKSKLDKTQELIIKTKELQILYPEQRGLEIDLKSLERMEKELFDKLINYYLETNFSIFEIKLSGEKFVGSKIPISQLGEILKKIQDVITSISRTQIVKEKKRVKPTELKKHVQRSFDGKILDIPEKSSSSSSKQVKSFSEFSKFTEFYLLGTLKGSVRVILSTPYPALDTDPLNNSLILFKDLVKCGDNRDLIQDQVDKIGDVAPISKYLTFLQSLSNNEIDLLFSGKTNLLESYEIINLDHGEAENIFSVIRDTDEPIKVNDIKLGVFRKIDLDDREFKFVYADEDNSDTEIFGNYKSNLDSEMEEKNFHENYRIQFISAIPIDKLIKTTKVEYELLGFLPK